MKKYFSRQYNYEWLIVAGVLWLTIEQFILGKYSYMKMGDVGNLILPGLLAQAASGTSWPLWHVYSTAGNDVLALGYVDWIDRALFHFLPGWIVLQLRTVLQCAVAAIALYVICRRTLGLEKPSSAVSALIFGYFMSGADLVASSDSFFPMTLVALSLVLQERSDWRRWVFLCALGLFVAHTSYLSRLMPFVFVLYVLWFWMVEPTRRIGDWLIICVFSASLIIVRLQDVFALVLYGRLSDRHAVGANVDFSYRGVAGDVLGYFTGSGVSILVTILLCGALLAFRLHNEKFRRLVIVIAVGVGMVLTIPLLKPLVVDYFPVVRTFRLTRLLIFVHPLLIMGAGFGVSALLRSRPFEKKGGVFGLADRVWASAPIVVLVILFGFSLQFKYGHLKEWVSEGNYVLNFESPVLKELAGEIDRRAEPVRVEAFQMYPNIPNAYGMETAGGYQALQIKRYRDFWTRMVEPGRRNAPPRDLVERLMLFVGPATHRPQWNLNELYNANLLALANVGYLISRDRMSSPTLVPLRQAEKPWSSLTTRQKIDSNVRANFTGRTHLYIYRNTKVFPRFFVVEKVRALATGEEVLDALAAAGPEELRTTAFVEKTAVPDAALKRTGWGHGTVHVIDYEADEIRLRLDIEDDSLLVATNAFSPFWKSYVDGVETTMFPTNHAFWGVVLPKSAKHVVFRYEPPYKLP